MCEAGRRATRPNTDITYRARGRAGSASPLSRICSHASRIADHSPWCVWELHLPSPRVPKTVLFHQRLQRRRAATLPRIWCLDFGTLLREKRDATVCPLNPGNSRRPLASRVLTAVYERLLSRSTHSALSIHLVRQPPRSHVLRARWCSRSSRCPQD